MASGRPSMVRPAPLLTRMNHELCMVETGVVVIVRETELAAVALGITIVAAMLTLPGVSESRMSLASLNV